MRLELTISKFSVKTVLTSDIDRLSRLLVK